MGGAGHAPLTSDSATHHSFDPAQPKIVARSFLGSGISAQVRPDLEAATSTLRPSVHQNEREAYVADFHGMSAVISAKSDSAPQPGMPALETQKSSADSSKAAFTRGRPCAANFPTASRQLPAQGDNASDGQDRQSTRGHDENSCLIRGMTIGENRAVGGQVMLEAKAHPAHSLDSFHSSHSAPAQNNEVVYLTSPPTSLPQQKDTCDRCDKEPSSTEGQKPSHHASVASSKFAAVGMSNARGNSCAHGNGKAPERSRQSHHSSGKENAEKHSNSRHVLAPRTDDLPRAATSSKPVEFQQEVGHRMHCFFHLLLPVVVGQM